MFLPEDSQPFHRALCSTINVFEKFTLKYSLRPSSGVVMFENKTLIGSLSISSPGRSIGGLSDVYITE
jgi:hypothetical protein